MKPNENLIENYKPRPLFRRIGYIYLLKSNFVQFQQQSAQPFVYSTCDPEHKLLLPDMVQVFQIMNGLLQAVKFSCHRIKMAMKSNLIIIL